MRTLHRFFIECLPQFEARNNRNRRRGDDRASWPRGPASPFRDQRLPCRQSAVHERSGVRFREKRLSVPGDYRQQRRGLQQGCHGTWSGDSQTGSENAGRLPRVFYNKGYENVEGIVAGTKTFVDFDVYMDAGVPKAEASTDSPYSPLVLKAANGRIISDRSGNLFHYVIEPALWGTKPFLVEKLDTAASQKIGVKYLPKADVLTAASAEASRKISDLLSRAQAWQPTLDECVGALVWMTPTLNAYFDEWRDSRYDPVASAGRYVAQSRVLEMRGIMSSLQITCNAILPELRKKDPALADQLKFEYESIMSFISRVDARDKASGGKMSVAEIEEMAFQAKSLTDQVAPHLKQMAALLGLKLPRKPVLA